MAQITSITSESLQAKIRELLPSQQGFGEDLQASNVILPVIDLTAAAQGTTTPQYMQTAFAFGSQTSYSVTTGTQVLANSAGFWRIYGQLSYSTNGATAGSGLIQLSDGLSTKNLWRVSGFGLATNVDIENAAELDVTVFLRSGDSVSAIVSAGGVQIFDITVRQVATVNGILVNPAGFTPQ